MKKESYEIFYQKSLIFLVFGLIAVWLLTFPLYYFLDKVNQWYSLLITIIVIIFVYTLIFFINYMFDRNKNISN